MVVSEAAQTWFAVNFWSSHSTKRKKKSGRGRQKRQAGSRRCQGGLWLRKKKKKRKGSPRSITTTAALLSLLPAKSEAANRQSQVMNRADRTSRKLGRHPKACLAAPPLTPPLTPPFYFHTHTRSARHGSAEKTAFVTMTTQFPIAFSFLLAPRWTTPARVLCSSEGSQELITVVR